MAIFHLSVKTISRSAGRSSTAAAAYRAGVEITDERTGEIHDYRRKAGVESAELFLPAGAPEWATDRAKLWNAAEQSEKRKNSTVAREFEVALPSELSADQRRELTRDFARELVKRHGFAVDVAIHAPGKDGDSKNHHAHILCTTRKLTAEGFTEKTRELDDRATGAAEVTHWREQWAGLTNAALERAGHAERIDHRTLEAQGIERKPSIHLGPSASAIERRGEVSQKTENHQARQAEAASEVAALIANSQARAAAALKAAAQETADALKQIQATAQAAAQAQREAALVLVQAAAAQAAIAQAQHEAAKQAALNTELTAAAEAKEKEDDGIRAAALAKIDGNVRAARASWEGTVSAVGASAGSLNASRRVADSNGKIADRVGRNTEIAAKGAERREFGKHLESSVTAVGKQLGNVSHVLQQLVDHLPNIVRSIAAAAQAVAQQVAKRLAKAPEQPPQAAQTVAKINAAKPPEKPPAPPQHPEIDRITFHTSEDKELAERTKALCVSTTQPGEAQRQQLAIDIQSAIIDAVATSRATEPKANAGNIDRDTKAEHNREAARAGKMEPWPQGQSNCALLVPAANAKRELEAHSQSGRPLMFGRKEYDDRTAALTSKHKAIEDAAKAAEQRLAREVAQRVAAARQQDAQNAPKHAHAELRIDSLKAIEKIATRERSVVRAREMQKPEHSKTRDRGRSSGGYER